MDFEENIICLGHMKHMKKSQIHRKNVALGNVGESSFADSFHHPRTPSTAAAVPLPRRWRSWGFAGQSLRPCRRLDIGALRSPLSPFARPLEAFYTTPGAGSQPCSFQWGVMGFLGDLREDRSRARPVGGSARRSIPSEREQPCCDL